MKTYAFAVLLLLSIARPVSALTQAEFCQNVAATAPEQALCQSIYTDPAYTPLLQSYSSTQPDLQWQVVKILREYAYKHTAWAPSLYSPLLIGNVSGRTWYTAYAEMGLPLVDSAPHRYQVFDAFNSGVFCGDTASTLKMLYEMFGYTAYQYHIQFTLPAPLSGIFSHEQTLVRITYNGSPYVILHDAMINTTFANLDGTPMDYLTLLQKLARHDAAHVRMLGDLNSPPDHPDQHLLRAHALFAQGDYGTATVQQIADASDDVDPSDYSWSAINDPRPGFGIVWNYWSPRTPARFDLIAAESTTMALAGQPADPKYLELFVQHVYSSESESAAAWNAIAHYSDLSQDIVWRNAATGQLKIWPLLGVVTDGEPVFGVTGLDWQIVGKADFSGDGQTDLLFRNQTTGQNVVWFMNGTTYVVAYWLASYADSNWKIAGAGDFNGDGQPDILWRNQATGENKAWLMNGIVNTSTMPIPGVGDTNWQIVGTGDFNRDGKTDILWRHQATGQNAVWFMDGAGNIGSSQFIQQEADTNWQIVGTRDFNSDGRIDILWRNSVDGSNREWLLDAPLSGGAVVISSRPIAALPDVNWQIR